MAAQNAEVESMDQQLKYMQMTGAMSRITRNPPILRNNLEIARGEILWVH